MPIEKFGRKVFREKSITLINAETKDKVTRTVLFSNMLWNDLQHMHEIHNRVWEADKNPALGLSREQFESYYDNFRETSIAAVIVDGDDPSKFIPLGGINAMRINTVIDKSGSQPERWHIGERDRIPLTWDACTNAGWFDTSNTRGNFDQVWPKKNGRTLICPTVYVKSVVKIGENAFKLGSLMKEIILAINSVAQETSEREDRSIHKMAYSAPRDLYKWSKTYRDLGEPGPDIDGYYFLSECNEQIAEKEKNCTQNCITGRDRMRHLYLPYQSVGGVLSLDEFEARDIPYFSLMNRGRGAFVEYVKKFGPAEVEGFLCATGRRMLDSVIGRHVSFGAKVGKNAPESRNDPTAMNHNTMMLYGSVVPKKNVKPEAITPSTNIGDSTL